MTFLLALPLFAIMLMLTPFVLLFDKHRRLAQHFVNNMWARVCTLLYYRVQVNECTPSTAYARLPIASLMLIIGLR